MIPFPELPRRCGVYLLPESVVLLPCLVFSFNVFRCVRASQIFPVSPCIAALHHLFVNVHTQFFNDADLTVIRSVSCEGSIDRTVHNKVVQLSVSGVSVGLSRFFAMRHLRRVNAVEPARKELAAERPDNNCVAVADLCHRPSDDPIVFGMHRKENEGEKQEKMNYNNKFLTASQAGSSQSVPCSKIIA